MTTAGFLEQSQLVRLWGGELDPTLTRYRFLSLTKSAVPSRTPCVYLSVCHIQLSNPRGERPRRNETKERE